MVIHHVARQPTPILVLCLLLALALLPELVRWIRFIVQHEIELARTMRALPIGAGSDPATTSPLDAEHGSNVESAPTNTSPEVLTPASGEVLPLDPYSRKV